MSTLWDQGLVTAVNPRPMPDFSRKLPNPNGRSDMRGPERPNPQLNRPENCHLKR